MWLRVFLATHYAAVDRAILLGLVVPASFVLVGLKAVVAGGVAPFSVLALLDFLRVNLAYFALVGLWCALLLRRSASQGVIRVVAIVYFLMLAGESLESMAAIHVTGADIPYRLALYSARSVGFGLASLEILETVFVIVVPAFFLWLALVKWHLLTKVEEGGYRLPPLRALATLSGLATLALLPPLHPDLERNIARPSYLYKIADSLGRPPLPEAVAADEVPALPPVTALIRRDSGVMPNLVFIILESVGARATGVHDPALAAVTPNLLRLAVASAVFERAYTVVPHTSKALVAILCGIEPFYRHPVFESHLGIPAHCLPSLLEEHGYRTAFFQSSSEKFENRRGLVAQMRFHDFVGGEEMPSAGFQLANYFGYEDAVMLEPVRQWLARRQGPFFAVHLTGTTHHPYWVPGRLGHREFVAGRESEERNRYLNAVHYLDWFVDRLLREYRDAGLYDDTIFVIVGDHGESFAENPRRQHNASLYEETLAVPLLVHSPRRVVAMRDSRIVSLTDLLPSVAETMGFVLVGETMGRSFFADAAARATATASCWYDDWCLASVDARYKYIYNFGEKREELYDLQADPQESGNLATREPELAVARREEVLRRHRENLARYDSFYRSIRPDYLAARGDSVARPASLLTLPKDDPRRQQAGFR